MKKTTPKKKTATKRKHTYGSGKTKRVRINGVYRMVPVDAKDKHGKPIKRFGSEEPV